MLALVMGMVGLALIPASICAAIYRERQCLIICIVCALVYTILGFGIYSRIQVKNRLVRARDGYAVVASCWIFACMLGTVVYYFSGQNLSIAYSIFESCAGFTTTGATVLRADVCAKSMLLFKAITHWLGGMGILVLVVSVLPKLGIGGQSIAMAETPTPKIEKVTDRISDTTRILYIMYLSFTLIEFVLLVPTNMGVFDSIVNTLSTISTGGFMTHDMGIGYYNSFYIETVITVFSILVSVNFNLYYFVLNDRARELAKNTELRTFLGIIVAASVLICLNLVLSSTYDSPFVAMRHAFTQVVSFSTTSGFTFVDFHAWPQFSRIILFIMMLIGGCASSTSGGLKVIRIMIAFKLIMRGFLRRIHPRSIVAIKLGDANADSKNVNQIVSFVITYFFIVIVSVPILSLQCPSVETAIGTIVSMISNTGIMFGDLYAQNGFTMYGPGMLIFLSLIMLIGRLEIFTMLMLTAPSFWNANRQKY